MKKILYLIIAMTLFLGVNVLYTLGLKDPSDKVISLKNSVPISLWILFFSSFILWIRKKIKVVKTEKLFITFCFFYVIVNTLLFHRSANLVVILNVFLAPVFWNILIRKYPNSKNYIFQIIITFFVLECCLAILSRALNENLLITSSASSFMDANVTSISGGFRSASIHGHPLQGALMLTVIMGFIYISSIKLKYKLGLLVLGCVALLCFNTRSSIVYWGGLLVFLLFQIIFSKQYKGGSKFIGVLILIVSSLGVVELLRSGWGGRLMELSLFDEDSAQARLDLFYMFRYLDMEDLLFGISAEEQQLLMYKSDVFIVENYWIAFIFSFGLISTFLFVMFVILCLKPLFKQYSKYALLFSVGSFLLISSTNNSLVSGVPAMSLLVLCAYSFPIEQKK